MFTVPFVKLLKIITDWALQNVSEREAEINNLFTAISWTNVDHNEVYKHLEVCELYGKSELSLYYLLHNLMMNNLLLGNFKTRYDGLHTKYEQVTLSNLTTLNNYLVLIYCLDVKNRW